MKKGFFTLNHLINNIYTTHALKTAISQSFNISLTDYCILLELDKTGGSVSPYKLTQQLAVTPSAITLRLNQLERVGLIVRQLREDDGRKVDVVFTALGKRHLPQIDKVVAQTIMEIWKPLTKVQRELLLRGSLAIVSLHRNVRTHSGRVRADTVYAEAVLIAFVSLSSVAKKHGLTLNEFSVLFALSKKRKVMRAVDVANMLLMRQNTLTVTIKTLEQKGYIELQRNGSDKRVHMLSITEAGNERFFVIYRPMSDVTRQRVGDLSTRELREFKAIGDAFIETERRRRALA